MMICQLHWQFDDGHTEMQLQREINSSDEAGAFVADGWRDHAPPKGAVWLMVREDSPLFVTAVK